MRELKPCYCGYKELEITALHVKEKGHSISCKLCGYEVVDLNTEAEAIEAWNRREGEK